MTFYIMAILLTAGPAVLLGFILFIANVRAEKRSKAKDEEKVREYLHYYQTMNPSPELPDAESVRREPFQDYGTSHF